MRLFVNDIWNDVGVSRNGVLDVSLSNVPDLARVVERTGEDVVTVWRPVYADDSLEVAFEEHDALAGAEVPDAAEGVHSTGGSQRTIVLECHTVHLFAVTLLE